MELQEFAFLGRVGQFLKPRSCLGANISLYCLTSEGSQESMQEGGSRSRVFLPFTSRRTGAPKLTGGGWEAVPGPGRCRRSGRRQNGEPNWAGPGSQVETGIGPWFKSNERMRLSLAWGMPGDASCSFAGRALQPVYASPFHGQQVLNLPSQ